VTLNGTTAYVQRGSEVVTDPDFDISKNYLTAGRKILHERSRSGTPKGREVLNFVRHRARRLVARQCSGSPIHRQPI
jgi:ribosomal protein L34